MESNDAGGPPVSTRSAPSAASPSAQSAAPAGKRWISQYPAGVPEEADWSDQPTLLDVLERAYGRYADRTAFTCLGSSMSYRQLDERSRALAGYLQNLGLRQGDRVAVMIPNILQSPVAVQAVLRAGMAVVNVNPLYTPRELRHQLSDSGAKAIILLENFGHVLEEVIADTELQHVVLTGLGDLLGLAKGPIVNAIARHVRRMVPPYSIPGAKRFGDALRRGRNVGYRRPAVTSEDLAFLQYTGGTTGVAKGAMLLHRNMAAALAASSIWTGTALGDIPRDEQPVYVCALPLYHIFALVNTEFNCMQIGGRAILIPDPRNLDRLIDSLEGGHFHMIAGVNTLFNALANHPRFAELEFSALRASVGGGAAVLEETARKWQAITGCAISEGYGLSETCSGICCNRMDLDAFTGTAGLPLPGVEIRILDEKGAELPAGEIGEVGVRGDAVMAGYWNRPEETAEAMTGDGFLRTGDIGTMDENGYVRIVDRKKDLILVSGFNVYPNEIEEVIAAMAGVIEVAAIGVPDPNTGEAVRVFIVAKPGVDEQMVKDHCRTQLVAYKRPKQILFVDSLPKSPVGKILRKELRGQG